MSTNFIQQEILLVTGSTFFNRKWCKNDPENENNYSQMEQVEEACWNGLLYEMLPEAYLQSANHKDLFLWQIKVGQSFIDLELGEEPGEIDTYFSIDPYCFRQFQFTS